MSTIPVSAVPVIVSPTWVSAVCTGCNQCLLIPAGTVPPLCSDCQHSAADNEARRLFSDIKDLVCGRGVFRSLSAVERATLLLSGGFTPATVAPFMDDQGLIDVIASDKSTEAAIEAAAAELVRRMPQLADDGSPEPMERQRIELEDEQQHREATIDREFAQVDVGHDGIFA